MQTSRRPEGKAQPMPPRRAALTPETDALVVFFSKGWWGELWETLKEWLSLPPAPEPIPVPAHAPRRPQRRRR